MRPVARRLTPFLVTVFLVSAATGYGGVAAVSAAPRPHMERYVLVARTAADVDALSADAVAAGGNVVDTNRDLRQVVVVGSSSIRASLAVSKHASGVAVDHVERLILPDGATAKGGNTTVLGVPGAGLKGPADPANAMPGLMWNLQRINAPQAWKVTTGSPTVLVGVADTGLDYTHPELADQVVGVVDFTQTESPPICPDVTGITDAELADLFGAPASDLDFNGHGSWIGGNIAADLDAAGINGIAPSVRLVALKISQNCGAAYDSEILDAFTYAANSGIDIVSISFGGYLNRSNPDENLIYQQYLSAVSFAASRGTVIVAAAGNEHVRIGAGGQVLSHGILNTPGDPLTDLFGLWETPGGIPGVIDVSSTGNVVNASSASCDEGSTGTAGYEWCKPTTDAHQAGGAGTRNQLAYYSNYGPRIDVAAPGGARKFNLPRWDRGGTPGWPFTGTDSVFGGDADGSNAWQDFSITSDWAIEIPCIVFDGLSGFPDDHCYSTIQGTSMATPHVSAVLALMASANSQLRHNPRELIKNLRISAQQIRGNKTPPLSPRDVSPGDSTGVACPTGYCHLGGPAIPDSEAYGAGLVDALNSLSRGR